MYNALSFNFYYLGNKDESVELWNKLLQISKVDVGYAPWVLEESKSVLTNAFFHYYWMTIVIIDYMESFY